MKKLTVSLVAVSILVIGALAYAHGPGGWSGSGYGGHMMGPGYGGHMMGQGHMRSWQGYGQGTNQEFLDQTADLREKLHNKRFDYYEASRNPKTKQDTLTKLEKEIFELQQKIRDKAPGTTYGSFGGYGQHCW